MNPEHVLLYTSFEYLHLFFTSNSVEFMTGGARIFLAPRRRVSYPRPWNKKTS